ncbi:CoA ester lyase [Saccharopolyspora taberi]|uniref:CoA ester lyase n=1 Tax=Saccharopolyspora taberi TaxID=60895 RepID=A0ABN3VEZ5_9PSEU
MDVPVRRGSAWLIAPAFRYRRSASAAADVVVLDLEDSVPAEDKPTARAAAVDRVREVVDDHDTVLGVRVNAPGTLHGLHDLVAFAESGVCPAVVVVPKVESSRDVELVATVLDRGHGPPAVWALVETPRAFQHLAEILGSQWLAGVVFGAADYAAATGCARSSQALWYPRSALAAGAAAAGVPALDSPYFDLDDPEGLQREAEQARDLGFTGKGAVHPRQLPVIRDAFAASEQELAQAHAVLAAAEAAHGGITTVDGRMVGPPIVAAARAVTAHAATPHGRSSKEESGAEQ